MKILKRLLPLLLFAGHGSLHGQVVKAPTFEFDSPQSGVKNYEAQKSIKLKPGFSFRAEGLDTWSGKLNPYQRYDTAFSDYPGSVNIELDPTKEVGTLPSSWAVSSSGAFSYSIPLPLPPGTATMTQLSLFYNNQVGNGIMGPGWNFSGLSAITREGQNFYNDSDITSVRYNAGDRFSLDGNRLIEEAGNYYTENETFRKIVPHGGISGQPEWFEVFCKDGLIMQYGKTSDSQHLFKPFDNYNGQKKIISWRLSRVVDRFGNYVEYIYSQSPLSECFLSEIRYTGNEGQGLAPYNNIKFNYVQRPDDNVQRMGTIPISSSKLLDNITVSSENQLVSTIKLHYDQTWIQPRLKEISFSDKDGKAYNSHHVQWQDGKPEDQAISDYVGSAISTFSKYITGDFDGDGYCDIISYPSKTTFSSSDSMVFYRGTNWGVVYTSSYGLSSTFKGSGVSSGMSNVVKPTLVYDTDGDGKDEIFMLHTFGSNQYKYKILGFDEGWFFDVQPDLVIRTSDIMQMSDVTGDKKMDIIFYTPGESSFKVHIFPGTTITHFPNGLNHITTIFSFDTDGDGMHEIVVKGYEDIWGEEFFPVYEWNPPTATLQETSVGYPFWGQDSYMGDFNGDNIIDELEYVEMWNNHHWSFQPLGMDSKRLTYPFGPDITKILLGDYNGDGKADVLTIENHTSTSTWMWYITKKYPDTTNDWYTVESKEMPFRVESNTVETGDFNGDGKQDVLFQDYSTARIVYFHPNEHRDQVFRIDDGLGNTVRVTTIPFTRINPGLSVGRNNYPVINTPSPLKVTYDVCASTGHLEQLIYENYCYTDMLHDRHRGGVMGFLNFEKQATWFSNPSSIYNYNETSVLYQLTPYNTLVQVGNVTRRGDEIITDEINLFAYHDYGNKRFFSYADRNVFTDHLSGVTTKTLQTINNEGNPTRVEKIVLTGSAASSLTEYSDYTPAGSWINSQPQHIKVTTKHKDDEAPYVDETLVEYYPIHGKIKKQTSHLGKSQESATAFTYTPHGNLESVTAGGTGITQERITTYAYDSKGRLPVTLTNAKGQESRSLYDFRFGVPTEVTDINGHHTIMEYDGFGRLKRTISPTGQETLLQNLWCLGETGSALYKTTISSVGLPPSATYYTEAGKVVRNEATSLSGKKVFSSMEYYPDGQLKSSTKPYFEGEAAEIAAEITYDRFMRPQQQASPQVTLEAQYNGLEITQKNVTTGQKSVRVMDGAGMVSTITDHLNTPLIYTYNSHGGLQSVVTPTKTVNYSYDDRARPTTVADPDRGEYTYSYNAFDELTGQGDARNNQYSLSYDVLGRISTKTGSEGLYSYHYDEAENGLGLPHRITGPGGHEELFTYDEFSRVKTRTEKIEGQSYTYQYSYNDRSQVETLTYPSGYKVTYTYSDKGYLQRLTSGETVLWQCLEMDRFGNVTKELRGNGKITTRKYDENGLPEETVTPDGSGGFVQNRAFKISPATGNLEWREDKKYGKKELFSYDGLDRLETIAVDGHPELGVHTTAYEKDGRIKSKSDAGALYEYKDNSHPHGVTDVSNPAGAIPTWNQDIEYTPFNMAWKITENCSTATSENCREMLLTYGHDHMRTTTRLYKGGQLEKTRIYSGPYEKEITTAQTRELSYIAGPTGILAVAEKIAGITTLHYVYTDHIGSWEVITTEDGEVEEEYSFDAWGRRRDPQTLVPLSFSEGSGQRLFNRGYTGHEHLDEFGLINMNGRMYDPVLGRMLSPDPVLQAPGYSQNYDAYGYAFNNPLKYTDPSGFVAQASSRAEATDFDNHTDNYIDYDGLHLRMDGGIAQRVTGGTGGGLYTGPGIHSLNTATNSISYGVGTFVGPDGKTHKFRTRHYGSSASERTAYNAMMNAVADGAVDLPAYEVYGYGRGFDVNSAAGRAMRETMKYAFGGDWVQSGGGSTNAEYPLSSTIGNVIGVATTFLQTAAQITANELKNAKYAVRGQNLVKQAAQFTKIARGIGIVGGIAGTAISGYNIVDGSATTIDYFDFGVGATSVGAAIFLASNPVGWAIGAGATIYFAGRLTYDFYQETNK